MTTLAVIGVDTELGRAVADRLAERGHDVIALDLADASSLPTGVRTVVHLGPPAPGPLARRLSESRLRGVKRVVVRSSAFVYGTWDDNPLPIPEGAPLRPSPDDPLAIGWAELDRQATDAAGDGLDVVVLRAAPIVGAGEPEFIPPARGGAPVQFLHLDDLARAIALSADGLPGGTYHVAPDGWIDAEAAAELVHGPLRRLWARTTRATGDAGHVVLANDRLKDAGWVPEHTSEEAWVAAQAGSVLAELSPSRRQSLALAASAGAVVAAAGVAVAAVRLRRR